MPLVKTAQIDEATANLNSAGTIVDPSVLFADATKPALDVTENIVSVSWDEDMATIPVSVYEHDLVQQHPGVRTGTVTIVARPSTTGTSSASSMGQLHVTLAQRQSNFNFQMVYGASGAQRRMAFIGLLARRSSSEDQRRDRTETYVYNLTGEGLIDEVAA